MATAPQTLLELLLEPIAQRSFAQWAMGFARPSASELLNLSSAQWRRMDTQASGPHRDAPGLQLLHSYWHTLR